MIYLASPYSSPIDGLPHKRFLEAEAFVAECVNQGEIVFSPIIYAHMMAKKYKLGTDAAFWMKFNMDMLRRAEAVFVLRLANWEQSQGVAIELNVAKMLGIPVVHFGPDFKPIQ